MYIIHHIDDLSAKFGISPFVSTIMSRYLEVFVFEKLKDSPLIPLIVVSASTRDFPSESSALRLPAN